MITTKPVVNMKSIMKKIANELANEEMLQKEKEKKKESEINQKPDRLDKFYDELKAIHKKHFYEQHFGQLYNNFSVWLISKKKVDVFFLEEDKMIKYIKEYAELYDKK